MALTATLSLNQTVLPVAQPTLATISVTNGGPVSVVITEVQPTINPTATASEGVSAPVPSVIASGQTITFQWTVVCSAPGTYAASAVVGWTDGSTQFFVTPNVQILTVYSPALLTPTYQGNFIGHFVSTDPSITPINPRAAPWNATGAGTNNSGPDDTAALNAAIASGGNGATVWFPPGSYRISAAYGLTILNSDVTLIGYGATLCPDFNCGIFNVGAAADRLRIFGFKIQGTLLTQGNSLGVNLNQGRISLNGSADTEIFDNTWMDTGGAIYFAGGKRLDIHHNHCLRTIAGFQGTNPTDVSICDNFLVGAVNIFGLNPTDPVSDDQIAVFNSSGTQGRINISRNFIDKQGPTAHNQAHAILVRGQTASVIDVIVADNICENVITTTGANGAASIEVISNPPTNTTTSIIVKGNICRNNNAGIGVSYGTSGVIVEGNRVIGATVVSGLAVSGEGIFVTGNTGQQKRLSVTNNHVETPDVDAIYVQNADNAVISGNTVLTPGRYGILLAGSDGVITSNEVIAPTSHGIYASGCYKPIISNNKVVSGSTYGVVVDVTSTAPTLVGNELSTCASGAYSLAVTPALLVDSTALTGLVSGAITQGPWTAVLGGIGFQNSWANVGGAYFGAAYRKDTSGRVYLRGLISTGTMGLAAFTMPTGFRPIASQIFTVSSNNAYANVYVDSVGNISPNTGSNASISLDGICWDTLS